MLWGVQFSLSGHLNRAWGANVLDGTLSDKTILITGGTSGIGRVAATALARMGARVVIAGRDEGRNRATTEQIRRETGTERVAALQADFASLESVRALASTFLAQYPRLDVLLNNAGAVYFERKLSADGYELSFATNHLAPFLLTNLLLGQLKADAPARIVTVGSAAHIGQSLNFDDIMHEKQPYRPMRAYGESKLANIMFTYALARRLQGSNVTANALHPGFVATNFGKNNGTLGRVGMKLASAFAISEEQGAQTSIYLASSPEVTQISGEYFIKSKPANSTAYSHNVEAQERLWTLSEQMTGLATPSATR